MYVILYLFPDFKLGKDENKKEKEKDVKMVLLKSKTADNDVLSKVKQMVKWVEKGHSVRVMIGQAGEKGDVVSRKCILFCNND